MKTMVRKIEELSINAFPALETYVYDGWLVRMSDGKAKRINSAYPLYPSTLKLEEKINTVESIYKKKGLRSVFKLTKALALPNMDKDLRERGYQEAGRTSIQVMDLDKFEYESNTNIKCYTELSDQWFESLCKINGMSVLDKEVHYKALGSINPKQCFMSYSLDDKTVAFARGVMEAGYIGIYGIYVDKAHRKKGLGELVTGAMVDYGKQQGCSKAYLQVEVVNEPAIKLYNKIGFEELYQYWYLLKEFSEL